MTRKCLFVLLGLTVALFAAACGSSNQETELPTEAVSEEAVLDLDAEELGGLEEETETARALDPITPSDYLVKNIDDYITPGQLEGLSVTQYTYEITDALVQEQIDAELDMYSEQTDVDRAAQAGDTIYVDLTATVEGSEEISTSSESTFFLLGDAEYGEDFDKELIGAKSGDELSFSITFDDNAVMPDWVNQTVDFEIAVTGVSETVTPEFDDAFASAYTDYSTAEEYRTALKDSLKEEYDELSYSDALETLIQTATDESVIASIPEDLYESCKSEILAGYATFLDTTDEGEILEEAGMTASDLKSECDALASRRLLISYICEKNNLSVSEDEYTEQAEIGATDYGFASAYEYEQSFTRTNLVWSLYERKAAEHLYESADVSTAPYEEVSLDDEAFYETEGTLTDIEFSYESETETEEA